MILKAMSRSAAYPMQNIAHGCSQYTWQHDSIPENMRQSRNSCCNASQTFCFITQASIDGCETAASHLWCCAEPACEDLGILSGWRCCWSDWPSCDGPGYCCQGCQRDDCPYLEGTDILVHVDPRRKGLRPHSPPSSSLAVLDSHHSGKPSSLTLLAVFAGVQAGHYRSGCSTCKRLPLCLELYAACMGRTPCWRTAGAHSAADRHGCWQSGQLCSPEQRTLNMAAL